MADDLYNAILGAIPSNSKNQTISDEDLNHPNVNKFLGYLNTYEGSPKPNQTIGYKDIKDYKDHPRMAIPFNEKGDTSTAAGSWQITAPTWDEQSKKQGLKDFTPINQKRAAVGILNDIGALDDIKNGKWEDAKKKAASQWASLPGSTIGLKTSQKPKFNQNAEDYLSPSDEKNDLYSAISGEHPLLQSKENEPTNQTSNPDLATTKESNIDLFKKGLINSLETTKLGVAQRLDPLAQQLEKSYQRIEEATGGTRSGRLMEQIQKSFNLPSAKDVAANREEEILRHREEEKPILSTTPGQVGNFVGDVLTTLELPGGTLAKSAAGGAVLGATRPTTKEENVLENTGYGALTGAAGQAVAGGISRAAQPITHALGELGEKSVKILKDAGVPLDAAQATGSRILAQAKAMLADDPVTMGAQAAFASQQKQAYTKAIAKTFGEDADAITPEIISAAKQKIGGIYDDVASRVNIQVDDAFKKSLSEVDNKAIHTLEESQYKLIKRNIDDVLAKSEKNNGFIDAAQYKNLKTKLDSLSGSANSDIAKFGRDLRDVLNKGLSDSAEFYGNKADVSLLKQANKQWGNMRKVEDVADFSTGEISPSKLYNSLKTKGKRYSFYQDDPELANLATAGKNILSEKVPNSGTTSRLIAQLALPSIAGGSEWLNSKDYIRSAEAAGGGALANKFAGQFVRQGIQKAINSQGGLGQYVKEGIPNTLIRDLIQLPEKYGIGKVPLAAFTSYEETKKAKPKKELF